MPRTRSRDTIASPAPPAPKPPARSQMARVMLEPQVMEATVAEAAAAGVSVSVWIHDLITKEHAELAGADAHCPTSCACRAVAPSVPGPASPAVEVIETAAQRRARERAELELLSPVDGMRTCPACFKQTRVTTAGCDHCEHEDK